MEKSRTPIQQIIMRAFFLATLKCFAFTTNWVLLWALSLYRLIHSLASFTLCEERTGDIVELLKFVFEENENMYELKVVLVDYAAWNVEILMRDAAFRQLLSRVSSLVTAIFHAMWTEDMTLDGFRFVSCG
jgi:hypothetical protein